MEDVTLTTDGFQSPRKTVKSARTGRVRPDTISTGNPYDVLKDQHEEMSVDDDTMDHANTMPANQNQTQRDYQGRNRAPATKPTKKPNSKQDTPRQQRPGQDERSTRSRAPPITVCSDEFRKITDALDTSLERADFFVKRKLDNKELIIYASNLAAFDLIKQSLSDLGYKYYTYTPKQHKLKNLILKGISSDYSCKEVHDEIKELQIPNVKIVKIVDIIFNKNKNKNRNILVQISNDSETHELTRIKHILHQGVKWEPLKRRVIHQCRNCQRVGHTSVNCRLDYRCVKCKESHGPGECKVPRDAQKEKVYCVNCSSYGHPASYLGCPFMKTTKIVRTEIKSRYNQTNENRINNISRRLFPSGMRDPSRSYSQSAGGNSNTNQHPSTSEAPQYTDASNEKANILLLLNEFKKQMFEMISNKFEAFYHEISENAKRIDALYDLYESGMGGE